MPITSSKFATEDFLCFLPSLQTILVVAVGPYGVVQLGSLRKVSKIFLLHTLFGVTKE